MSELKLCTCVHPEWVSHDGGRWFICGHCFGTAPHIPKEEIFQLLRLTIDEGRARLARQIAEAKRSG